MSRGLRTLAAFAGAAFVLGLLGLALRGVIAARLLDFAATRTLGVHATARVIGGSVLTGIRAQGVQARAPGATGSLVALDAGLLVARYSPLALLRGLPAFLASLEITLEDGRAELDLTRPAAQPTTGVQPITLPTLPRITLRNSKLSLRSEGYGIEASGLEGTLEHAGAAGEQMVSLRAARFRLRQPQLREGEVALALTGRYAPRSLVVTAAQVDGVPVADSARLDFGSRGGDLDLHAALRPWGGTASVEALWRAQATEVKWDAQGVDLQLRRLFVNPAFEGLRGVLTTQGTMRRDAGGLATLAGKLSLDWQGGEFDGRRVDRVTLEAVADRGTLRLSRAEARVGANEVRMSAVSLSLAHLSEARWRSLLEGASGTFDASLGNVPEFLAMWGVRKTKVDTAFPSHRLRLQGSLEKRNIRLSQGEFIAGAGKTSFADVTIVLPSEGTAWGATVISGHGDVDVPDLGEFSAILPLPTLRGSVRGGFTVSGTVARPEGSATLSGRRIGLKGRLIDEVALAVRGGGGELVMETLQARQGRNSLVAKDLRFVPAALAAHDRDALFAGLSGSFMLRAEDLPALAGLAGVSVGKLRAVPARHRLTVEGTLLKREIRIATATFTVPGGSATVRDGRVVLPGPGIGWAGSVAEGSLDVDIADLEKLAGILPLPPLSGSIRAQVRLAGRADALTADAEVSGRAIAVSAHPVGDVAVKAALHWPKLDVTSLEVSRGENRYRAAGQIVFAGSTTVEATLRTLDVESGDIRLSLDGPASVGRGGDGAIFVRGLVLSGATGRIVLDGTRDAAGRADLRLNIRGARSGRWFATLAGETIAFSGLDADLIFQGTPSHPRLTAVAHVAELRGRTGPPLRADLDAEYEEGRLRVRRLDVGDGRKLSARAVGDIPLDPSAPAVFGSGPISFQAKLAIPAIEELAFLLPDGFAAAGALTADLRVSGSWKDPVADLSVSGEGLQPPQALPLVPPGPYALAGRFSWKNSMVQAETFQLASAALSVDGEGTWKSPPALETLLRGHLGNPPGTLAAKASFASADIGWARAKVPGLRRLRGSVSGTVAVAGPVRDPTVSGTVLIEKGSLGYGDLPIVDGIAVAGELAGRIVALKEAHGTVGGSPFTLAGSVNLANPREPELDLTLRGQDTLLYRNEALRVRADSDLRLRGTVGALLVSGEVALTNSLYQRSFTVGSMLWGSGASRATTSQGLGEISFPDPPLRDMRFDVRLIARKPLQIRSNVARGAAWPDLRLSGTGLLPVLRGTVTFESAQVILPSGTLQVEHGSVFFLGSDTNRPHLDFSGRTSIQGYDVTVQVGGALDAPEVLLSSVPPLANDKLLLLVLTGAPPTGVAQAGAFQAGASSSALASPVAVYLGRGLLDDILSLWPAAEEKGFQDRLELHVGREISRSGSPTVESSLRLKAHLIRRGDALYLTSEKDAYDQYNIGLKLVFRFGQGAAR